MSAALARVTLAAERPEAIADELRAAGQRIVWTLGWDIPRELIDAFGLAPVRLVPGGHDTRPIDPLVSADGMSGRGRALLAAIAAIPAGDLLLISHADAEQPQLFATLRELTRTDALPVPETRFLDLLTIDRAATRTYNRVRLGQVMDWLERHGRAPALREAIVEGETLRAALRGLMAHRAAERMTGGEAHRLIAAAASLPVADMLALVPALDAEFSGRAASGLRRLLLSGTEIEKLGDLDDIEGGRLIVAEDHGWGEGRLRALTEGDPIEAIALSTLNPIAGPFSLIADRAALLPKRAAALNVSAIVHAGYRWDEGTAWEVAELRAAAGDTPFEEVRLSLRAEKPQAASAPKPAAAPPRKRETRSRKSLKVIERFGAYQREWFAGLREQVAAGAPFAGVNANTPQETLRAMGVLFVVNQWWASIVAAKQQSGRYSALLEAAGFPTRADAYSSQGVAAALDQDAEQAPWGGLPKPDSVSCVLSSDATPKLFENWAIQADARLQRYHRSTECRWDIPVDWWDGLAEDWEHFIEPERLDLFEAELHLCIAELEEMTGKPFDMQAFVRILDLVNEQEDLYRATRDLIARTVPAPISVVDQMPATMVPQWHRGTEWARDAAQDFYDEVAARAAAGEAACPGERLRLMFVGRGVWSDMGFYQRWEESHGAVFVCSMYLSLAADGYIRRHDSPGSGGRDPMRAMAARFVTMGDELRMPTWAGAWHVKEAKLHGCHGAMALSDADPLVLRILREAGIPVLELGMDNFARDPEAEAEMERRAADFLDGLLSKI